VAVGNLDLQGGLDAAQVHVHRAAQVAQAGVVGWGEQVAKDHVDISFESRTEILTRWVSKGIRLAPTALVLLTFGESLNL